MKTIKVKGMSCQHCVKAVTEVLEKITGIENVSVSLEKGEAIYEDKAGVDPQMLVEAVKKIGFDAEA